jgi:flavodoxin
MKGVIVYDSVYGNTELVAKMIAARLEAGGHSVRIVRVKDALKDQTEGDFLFLGSPTRMGGMTGRMKKLIKGADWDAWGKKPVATFDTEMDEVIAKDGASAAAKMHDMVRSKGAKVHTPVLKVGVTGVRGPLSLGSEKVIEAYLSEFLSSAAC